MNNPIIYWVIFGLLTLFYFYLVYKFTETWRALHVVCAFFVFTAALMFAIVMAMSLRTHNTWRSLVTKHTKQIEEMQSERDDFLYGNLGEVIQSTPSIRSVNSLLRRAEIDRGRVWRGAAKTQPPQPDDTVTVSTVPAGIAPGDAEPNRIEENSILYVFIEAAPATEDGLPEGVKIPRFFVGEFTASAVTDTSVTLKPTFPLADIEKGLLRQPAVTWTLYETIPVDGHHFFAMDPVKDPNLKEPASEQPVFGDMDLEMMQRTFAPLRQVLQEQTGSGEAFQRLMQRYMLDGTPVDRQFATDFPDRVWYKLSFKKAYEDDVDTAGDPLGVIKSSEVLFFDREGRAEVALLRQGEKASFKVGDWGLFPPEDAERLIQEGFADAQELVFVRPLNDYKGGLRSMAQRMSRLAMDINQATRDTAEVTRANQLVQEQIAMRRDEQDKINQDLERFQYEKEQITQYAAKLTAEYKQLRKELSGLYAINNQLLEQMVRLDADLTEAINRRTVEAVQ